MSYDKQKVALYSQGTFDKPATTPIADMLAAADEIAQAGFGTLIMGQWHAHYDTASGQFTVSYNRTVYSKEVFDEVFSQVPARLKAGGVQKVLLTFGPFTTDFEAIQQNLPAFKDIIQQLFDDYGIDGLDLDPELPSNQPSPYTPEMAAMVVDLATWVGKQGKTMTAAPYWPGMEWYQGVLEQAPYFEWLNMQAYGGGNYEQWVQNVTGLPNVSDPQAFVTYGFSAAAGTQPSDITSQLQSLQQQYPDLDGGFIWQYESIKGNAAAYAQAIIAGLS